ncbi:hypothetical protein DB346_00240 [Verrucomicrobia bacterium LW23]|nr:hypothetical protein DB346_00240 [Verrucomicrobia bacterium LW23]
MNKKEFSTGTFYLIILVILGVTLLFPIASFLLVAQGPADTLEAERELNRLKVHHELEEAANKTATTTAWVDEKAGIARIPIARAMELELPALAASKPAAGNALPATPAAAPAAPAPAPAGATNAPAATPAPAPAPAPAATNAPAKP